MSNSSASAESVLIDSIKSNLLASIGLFSMILGTIGTFFNIFLFTRGPIWRQSPCIPYLLGVSIAGVFIIYTNILMRTLQGFQVLSLYYIQVLCKIVVYVSTASNVSATWFMVAACFDRYASSSIVATRRLMSNMRTTRRVMTVIIFTVLIAYIEILYCYESISIANVATCMNKNAVCATLDACVALIAQLISPLLLIVYFGVGTFFNIRHSAELRRINVNSVVPIIPEGRGRAAMANERAVFRVISVQVVVICICTLPLMALKVYQIIPSTIVKSDVRRSVESLLNTVCPLVYTLDKVYSFYIYTLASDHFRKELKRLLYSFFRRRRVDPEV